MRTITCCLICLGLAPGLTVGVGCAAGCPKPNLDLAVCDPGGTFTLDIDNPFFPLEVGRQLTLEGKEGKTDLRVIITALDETEEVAGVICRVVEEAEYEDGEVIEISRNYFAQAADGTLCYFGEAVDVYEDGQVVDHPGAWRAGEGENRAGIMMPADPRPGDVAYQEWAPGVAKDLAAFKQRDVTVTTPAGTFEGALRATDCNPMDGGKGTKIYAPGIGLVVDGPARLVSHTP